MQINQKTHLTYVVGQNETLSSICGKYNLDIGELKELNQIQNVKAGDVILLSKQYKNVYVVKPLDTYESIAQKMNVSVQVLKNVTKNKKMYIGQKIMF